MNKIEEMIKELCPNGVEWKKLGEICEISTGKGITKKDEVLNGKYPIISGGITPMGYYNSFNRNANTITVSRVGANAGYVNFITCNFYLNDKCFSVIPIDEKNGDINVVYLYHYLKYIENNISELQSEGGVPTINTTKLSSISIPLPPLPIQTEIVRILDKFVEQQEQIERLIELRKKQYEYYREEMLKPKEGEKWETKTLGEIGKISIGKKPNEILDKGTFEYINAGTTCSGYSETYNFEGDTITTPSRGEGGIGFVGYQKKRFWCGPLCYAIKTSENNKFIYHYLTLHNKLILDLKCEGGVPALNRKDLITIEIQVPPVAVQEKIVHTLDSFETSITTLTTALELSKKRYEYYRDKMMRF
ncbi:MAG: restriction endonuclease subunit S [Paludibacteraceae bacterium]|nr:restriction endonuclease subunit S [Paludibacteraceae bacterium]